MGREMAAGGTLIPACRRTAKPVDSLADGSGAAGVARKGVAGCAVGPGRY